MLPRRIKVNAWTEWGRLRAVCVGVTSNPHYVPSHPAFMQPRNDRTKAYPTGAVPEDRVKAAAAQLDNLADVLQEEGVDVLRPDEVDCSLPIVTPDWAVPNQFSTTCIGRDGILVHGNTIIETPKCRRDEYFTVNSYRRLLRELFDQDLEMRWLSAPKPMLKDTTFRKEFWDLTDAERLERKDEQVFNLSEDEVLFDAADMMKIGRDIAIRPTTTTNWAGIEWVRRELGTKGVRLILARFPNDVRAAHMDATFVPLRPGLALKCPAYPMLAEDREVWERNGWRFIEAPEPDRQDVPEFSFCSKWLSINLLSVSPDTVVVEAEEKSLQDLLRSEGFRTIPVPFRKVYEFGGSLHCATLDFEREDSKEDHFPKGVETRDHFMHANVDQAAFTS